jgi:hypothetical protein
MVKQLLPQKRRKKEKKRKESRWLAVRDKMQGCTGN